MLKAPLYKRHRHGHHTLAAIIHYMHFDMNNILYSSIIFMVIHST